MNLLFSRAGSSQASLGEKADFSILLERHPSQAPEMIVDREPASGSVWFIHHIGCAIRTVKPPFRAEENTLDVLDGL